MKSLAVIIVNYRTADLTIDCVMALADARVAFPGLQVIVVDGGSADGSSERIAESIIARDQSQWVTAMPLAVNGGFAYANNRALAALSACGDPPEAIALINPDARVRPGALEAMAARLKLEPGAGAVGARLEHEDGRPQASAFHFPSLRNEFCRGAQTGLIDRMLGNPPVSISAEAPLEVPWVTGAAVMFRSTALWSTGMFDEGFFLYFEETELMHRLRAKGWSIWHEPTAKVVHAGGAATQIRDAETGQPKGRRMPAYWYRSRRRYFALTGGFGKALAANVLWLAGHSLWLLRSGLTGARGLGPARIARDLLTFGFWPRQADSKPAALAFGTMPPARPAWHEDDR